MNNHSYSIRRKILDTAFSCGKGCHVGSSLSVVDILVALFDGVIRDKDELILSKGHAALAWYATLNEFGYLSDDKLSLFEKNGSPLTVLAVKNPDLMFKCSTGSLGQGISVAVGMAIAMKRKEIPGKVYVIVGDGECNEGVVWEAALLAAHNKLDNLCVLVDYNKFQSDGDSKNIINVQNPKGLWESVGFSALEVDGNNSDLIKEKLIGVQNLSGPIAIICNTIKGAGVSFMENSPDWHYNRLTKERYDAAILDLESRK